MLRACSWLYHFASTKGIVIPISLVSSSILHVSMVNDTCLTSAKDHIMSFFISSYICIVHRTRRVKVDLRGI